MFSNRVSICESSTGPVSRNGGYRDASVSLSVSSSCAGEEKKKSDGNLGSESETWTSSETSWWGGLFKSFWLCDLVAAALPAFSKNIFIIYCHTKINASAKQKFTVDIKAIKFMSMLKQSEEKNDMIISNYCNIWLCSRQHMQPAAKT